MKVADLLFELSRFPSDMEVMYDDRKTLGEYGCLSISEVAQVEIFESPSWNGGNEDHGGVVLR